MSKDKKIAIILPVAGVLVLGLMVLFFPHVFNSNSNVKNPFGVYPGI